MSPLRFCVNSMLHGRPVLDTRMVLEAAFDYSWKDQMLLQTFEWLFTPIVAVHEVPAAVYGCVGTGELYLRMIRLRYLSGCAERCKYGLIDSHWSFYFLATLWGALWYYWTEIYPIHPIPHLDSSVLNCKAGIISQFWPNFTILTCSNRFSLQPRKAVSLSSSSLTLAMLTIAEDLHKSYWQGSSEFLETNFQSQKWQKYVLCIVPC